MNRYRIHYVNGQGRPPSIDADSINGFKPTCDTYVFKIGEEVVAAIPKVRVVSITKSGDAPARETVDDSI